jgi:sulfate transport system ATP-binding protein
MSISARHISKTFGSFRALDDVSLDVATGELVALLGPSGSGKTTLLRVIAGLETADPPSAGGRPGTTGGSAGAPTAGRSAGVVSFDGQDVTARDVGRRGVGFVFQHYALFRHMTVFENVAFGLRVLPWRRRPRRRDVRKRVEDLLDLVQLRPAINSYPSQLSGGMRQRVALARALAVEPKVLLLDEPFGALDARVRRDLRRWLRRLHDEVHVTSVFVTHDQEEALEVADRVAVMNKGRIEQVGTPEEVYERPATPFVYKFLGNVNLFHGRVEAGRVRVGQAEMGDPPASGADGVPAAEVAAEGSAATAYVRPHDVEITRDPHPGALPATVDHVNFPGPFVQVYLTRPGGEPVEAALLRETYRGLNLRAGDAVYVQVRNARVFVDDYSI